MFIILDPISFDNFGNS